jgi:hypothetical protein
LATEAVFGPNEEEHEAVRHDLALYVDEGRSEGRRPEFSGEVPRELASRVRKLMGGDVELSYPVLGPDDFVVSALKEQVRRQRVGQGIEAGAIDVSMVVEAMFEELGLEPGLARKRIRPIKVARGRALVAWLCVERLGHAQVEVAEGLGLKSGAVTKMLSKLRQEGLTKEEAQTVERVLGRFVQSNSKKRLEESDGNKKKRPPSQTEPRVIIMKRKR